MPSNEVVGALDDDEADPDIIEAAAAFVAADNGERTGRTGCDGIPDSPFFSLRIKSQTLTEDWGDCGT